MFTKNKKERKTPEINTTALPDIIFMLLFFFMVTTVMQPAKPMENLVLPNTITDEATAKTKPNELIIFLFQNDQGQKLVSIDKKIVSIESFSSLLNKRIAAMKANQLFPNKAILKIDQFAKMSAVNQIKEALKKEEILEIEFVHRKV